MDNATRVVHEIIAKIAKKDPADMGPDLKLAEWWRASPIPPRI